ncbi:MAG: prepilin-type N-terminal cleavage/methylation domain-containing protein [Candidatus Atribacteria bacterium]|nr:prepilin-type N-terminal cleavage/methylation domain-containing protein [Candidatus Atribacteria bacterium]
MMQWLWSSIRSKNQGISLVEIVLVLAVSAFLFLALASLLLRTSVTKAANER